MKHFGILTSLIGIMPVSTKRRIWLRRYGQNPKVWGEVYLQDEIDKNCKLFLSPDELKDKLLMKNVQKNIVDCYILYGTIPNEYFMFDFFHKRDKVYRQSCLSVMRKDQMCLALRNSNEALRQMTDKGLFYTLTAKFFKRDVLVMKEAMDKEKFLSFYSRHNNFIVKPLNGQCGVGTFISKTNNDAYKTFNQLLGISGGVIIEELIRQSQETATFNESSVNTVRLPSIYNRDGQTILQPFFRTGRKGQVVDNGGSGGIFAVIDPRTGKLVTDGYDELGHHYKEHPDSHISYKGWQIPRWQELINLSNKIHKSLLPINKYIGFDFALTDDGWVLVEGNWGQFLGQYATGIGIKKEFEQLMKKS